MVRSQVPEPSKPHFRIGSEAFLFLLIGNFVLLSRAAHSIRCYTYALDRVSRRPKWMKMSSQS
ncbi:hypothetical protein [Rubritalea tangerina]|uniref:hypothetical protein n=1 Tax=Rubritalea tangerina TaxID=430798 RepID=UPI003608CB02